MFFTSIHLPILIIKQHSLFFITGLRKTLFCGTKKRENICAVIYCFQRHVVSFLLLLLKIPILTMRYKSKRIFASKYEENYVCCFQFLLYCWLKISKKMSNRKKKMALNFNCKQRRQVFATIVICQQVLLKIRKNNHLTATVKKLFC